MEYSKGSPSYYGVLGVSLCSSDEEIRRAYRKLAMQWHPDKWTRTPALLGEAKQKFQQIQEAYSVLSDRQKRRLYDVGLYNPEDDNEEEEEEVEGFADFVQEMLSLVNDARKEGRSYSIEELQRMFWDMAQGFEIPEWSSCSSLQQPMYDAECFLGSFSLYESTKSSCEVNMIQGNQNLGKPGFETYVTHNFF